MAGTITRRVANPAPALRLLLLSALLGAMAPVPAASSSLFVSQGTYSFNGEPQGVWIGGSDWSSTTVQIEQAFDAISIEPALDDLDALFQHDALWIDLRNETDSLSPIEQENLSQFIATGRRVVFIGENNYFLDWNESFFAVVGGSIESPSVFGMVGIATDPTGALLEGVSSVDVLSAGVLSSGGVALFDPAIASLWGPHDNVLGVFDSGLFADVDHLGRPRISLADNRRFRDNVVGWLAVPEPGTAALVLWGLCGVSRWNRLGRSAGRYTGNSSLPSTFASVRRRSG